METATSETPAARPALPASIAVRVGLVLTAWVGVPWLVVGAFVAGVVPGGAWTMAALGLASLAPIVVLLRGFVRGGYPGAATRLLVLRPFWYVFLFLPLVAIATLLAALVGWPLGGAVAAGRGAALGTAAVLALVALAGYVGSRHLVVKRLEVAHPRLPAAFDGLRVAQLSDVHVGPHTSRRHLRRIARVVEEERPDLVAHTGDQVDDHAPDVVHFARAFGDLRAPFGSFAIAGNHDVYAGWSGVERGLRDAGIRVLVNEAVPIERGGERIFVAGTGDPAGAQRMGPAAADGPAPDLDATMAAVPPGAFSLVLAHNPALWPGLADRGASLTLAGHTHHGQLSVPALGWCLASPFLEHAMGRHERGGSVLYINPGTNHWGLPFRLGAWPEVTIVTLRRSA